MASHQHTQGSPRVLFAPETINIAEVTRGIEVAKRLAGQVECIFAGFSPRNRELIEQAGFEFIELPPRLTDAQAQLAFALDQGRTLRHPFTRDMLSERVASERNLISKLNPAAVVIGVTPSQFISARAQQVPLVFVRPYAYSLPHIDAAYRTKRTGFLPRETARQRLKDAGSAWLLRTIGRHLPLPRPFYQVAAEHGVRLPRGVLRAATADVNLIATAPQFLPTQLQLPPDHEVVGPIFAQLPGEVPEFVDRLAAGHKPLVYFAIGSSGNRDLALNVLRGLGAAHCEVIAPVRSHLLAEDLAGLPDNVHVTNWLPAHRLGDAIDLAITHGGEGTVQNSCSQGWPFIGIPLQFEQRFNVTRCVEFGSARLVPQRQIARTDWAGLVADALRDERMRARAAELARLLAILDGPGQAAQAILRLVHTS